MKLFQDYGYGEGFFSFYGNEEEFVITPYFKRKINKENDFIDIISPWYYGGPIHNIQGVEKLRGVTSKFLRVFNEYCENNNIISEFQRLNPILENQNLFLDLKDINVVYDRKIVYIDLRKSEDEIWSRYSRHTRKNIKKAKREGLEVFRSDNAIKDIDIFIDIYHASMDQKDAKKFYYFNEEFFKKLSTWFKDELSLFFIKYKNEIITASLELGKFGILHDYLRGSKPEYNILRPTELLLDEIAKWAKKNDYEYMVIGGGNTNAEDDQLLKFKQKMSPFIKNYYLYKKVHNLEIYNELCRQNKMKSNLEFENASFFPEYRINNNG